MENRPYTTIDGELIFAAPYREDYFKMIRSFSEKDLGEIEIIRPALGHQRKLGDYLMRIAYHEAIHAGNIMSCLRTAGITRPNIWD